MSKGKNDRNKKLFVSLFVWVIYILWILQVSSIKLNLTNFLLHLLFLGILVFIYRDDLKKDFKNFKKDGKKGIKSVLLYTLILFGILLVSNVLITVISKLMGGEFAADSSSQLIGKLFHNTPFGTLFVMFLTIIFYSVVEELVFRKSIRDNIKSPVLFVIVSSLITWYFQATIFSPQLSEFVVSLSVLFNSIFASIVYVKKGNILYAIFPRMLYNLIICCVQLIPLLAR